jgi:hypothetical protein
MATKAAGVSGSRAIASTGASLIAPRRAIGRPSCDTSSSAGSSSGSSARDKGAVTISHNKVRRTSAAIE